ncbi:MAG: S8 family serine peptidase, partial [Anaerolineae bacterium]|nr:S8 family serine peptidase [Anaerolineae bacterium]
MTRPRPIALLIAILALLVITLTPAAGAAQPFPSAVVEPELWQELAEKKATTFLVYMREEADLSSPAVTQAVDKLARRQAVVDTLRATATRSQQDIRAYLDKQQAAGHVSAITSFWVVNALAVTGDAETASALAARPDVARLTVNHVRPLEKPERVAAPDIAMWNIERVRAPRVWQELGITGRGVVVANMDTGVAWTHPALRAHYRGFTPNGVDHNYNWFDATGTSPALPMDDDSHGSHTMGTMVGEDNSRANQIGVAPGAKWIAVRIFTPQGTTDAWIHAGFQWLLAPTDLNGNNPDPGKAPDIVNNSWGSGNIADPTFWNDLMAWRAAGIFSSWSAGNRGVDGPGSIGVPGGYPHAFNVGATDPNDILADFSSLGPGFWTPAKPNVSAPGDYVRSSVLGNSYDFFSGTSMAAPHVAGTAALLLAADPNLTVPDLETILARTAWDLGPAGFDPGYGAGRVDAYAAVRWALSGGRLGGQVRDALTGAPIARALVEGLGASEPAFRTATDDTGYYAVAVPGGSYDVTAAAFGYVTATVRSVEVVSGFQSLRDLALAPAPTARIGGELRDAFTGAPLTATVHLLDTPLVTTANANGLFHFDVPEGCYTWLALRPGYRRLGESAGCVQPGLPASFPVKMLAPAPSLLLLDADAWLEDDATVYFKLALDRAGYLYDTRRITSTAILPTLAELRAYDIVIWAHPWASPGEIDAIREDQATQNLLSGYVNGGGRLLLSGQNVGFYDGGGQQGGAILPYYRNVLHAQFAGNVGVTEATGIPGEAFSTLTVTLPTVDSYNARSGLSSEEIAPADSQAVAVMEYGPGDTAALRVSNVGPGRGRLLYFGFGLERAGPLANRAELLRAALTWLAQPSLVKGVNAAVAAPGDVLTYTLALSNSLRAPAFVANLSDRLADELDYVAGSVTGGAAYDPATRTIFWSGWLTPGAESLFGFQAEIDLDVPGGARVANRANLATGELLVPVSATVVTTIAAPDLRTSVKEVDKLVARTGDTLTYTITLRNDGPVAAHSTILTDPIPAGLSYVAGSATGGATYDSATQEVRWTGTISAAVAGTAAYTWTDSTRPGGPAFSWVDISTTGAAVSLSDDQLAGPFPIGFAFPYFGQSVSQFWLSSNGWIAFSAPTSSFFSNERIPSATAPANIVAIWWDDLHPGLGGTVRYGLSGGRLVVSFEGVPRVDGSGPYTFQAIVEPSGQIRLQYLTMAGTRLNEATIGLQDSTRTQGFSIVHNAAYVQNNLAVRIDPPQSLNPGTQVITFRALVEPEAEGAGEVVNVAHVAPLAGDALNLSATTRVRYADFSDSRKEASATVAAPGSVITYSIAATNTGNLTATLTITDPIPTGVSYVEGSATGGAAYDAGENLLRWQGVIPPNGQGAFAFRVQLSNTLTETTEIVNVATIAGGTDVLTRTARLRTSIPNLQASFKIADRATARGGDVLTYTITLRNEGFVTATARLTDSLPAGLAVLTDTLSAGATYDAAQRQVRWQGTVPPQTPGYTYRDSDQQGGPTFDWIDLRGRGTPITGLGDDTNLGPFPIGFPFTFYGHTFTTFRVSSNGWVSFDSSSTDYVNRTLPDASAPRNLLAIWWGDLSFLGSGQVLYWTDGVGTLVISYLDVPLFSGSGGPYTFQAILRADGSITYQYLDMNPPLNEATIGIQNATGTEGLTVASNRPYVHDNLAIRFAPPAGVRQVTYQARLASDLPSTTLTNTAVVDDGRGNLYRRAFGLVVNTVDLGTSSLEANRTETLP